MSEIERPNAARVEDELHVRGKSAMAPDAWLMLLVGVALVGWGSWYWATSKSPIYGPGAVGIGLTLMPWRIVGFIGGAGLVLLGGFRMYEGYGVQAGVMILVGVMGIAERLRRS